MKWDSLTDAGKLLGTSFIDTLLKLLEKFKLGISPAVCMICDSKNWGVFDFDEMREFFTPVVF